MKKKIVKLLRKAVTKLDPPFSHVKNYNTYYAVCSPYEYGVCVDFDRMVKELSRRTGVDEETCEKIYSAEDDILNEIGLIS